jgi:hypothetical protein
MELAELDCSTVPAGSMSSPFRFGASSSIGDGERKDEPSPWSPLHASPLTSGDGPGTGAMQGSPVPSGDDFPQDLRAWVGGTSRLFLSSSLSHQTSTSTSSLGSHATSVPVGGSVWESPFAARQGGVEGFALSPSRRFGAIGGGAGEGDGGLLLSPTRGLGGIGEGDTLGGHSPVRPFAFGAVRTPQRETTPFGFGGPQMMMMQQDRPRHALGPRLVDPGDGGGAIFTRSPPPPAATAVQASPMEEPAFHLPFGFEGVLGGMAGSRMGMGMEEARAATTIQRCVPGRLSSHFT